MVLDVLLQAQQESLDDLSFRYGCRARNCGVCTIDINGKPRLACRARVKEMRYNKSFIYFTCNKRLNS